MRADQDQVFYYRAHANAFGGALRQPLVREVSTRANASLPTAGGHQYAVHEQFHVDGLISVARAYVRVSGTEHVNPYNPAEGRSWRTVVSATIEGLNILEVVTADRIVAQVAVKHARDGKRSTVTLLGSRYENLRVHGHKLDLSMNPEIFGAAVGKAGDEGSRPSGPLDFEELISLAGRQQGGRKLPSEGHAAQKRMKLYGSAKDVDGRGTALCSLVEKVNTTVAPLESYGHMLHVPDFGNIFLGELLVDRASAQLTMLRVEMGCMAEGDLSGCSTSTDGRPMP